MKTKFIKVVDQGLAEQLASLGFQYIKEGLGFSFMASEELMSVLQQTYALNACVFENKLRF